MRWRWIRSLFAEQHHLDGTIHEQHRGNTWCIWQMSHMHQFALDILQRVLVYAYVDIEVEETASACISEVLYELNLRHHIPCRCIFHHSQLRGQWQVIVLQWINMVGEQRNPVNQVIGRIEVEHGYLLMQVLRVWRL